ncbi:hypothetical protein GGI24_007046, partial [Coemansia furcata]
MGVLKDNNKRKSQGIRAPIPVPGSWAIRVADSNYHPSAGSAEADPMLKLQDHIRALATDLETSWLEQQSHLKAAEEVLSDFIRQKIQLSDQALNYLRL